MQSKLSRVKTSIKGTYTSPPETHVKKDVAAEEKAATTDKEKDNG